jgi:hypothetical protein
VLTQHLCDANREKPNMLRTLLPTSASANTADDSLNAQWRERIVSAIGVSLAVLVVAGVAVLMGMA